MERLTARDRGHAYYKKCFEEPCLGCGCEIEDCQLKIDICSNLARYEDLGVTPDQIQEIDKLYLEKCEEVNLLKKQLEVIHEGDLISRKKLEKDVRDYADKKCFHGEVELANGILKSMSVIKNQPTAYDVDKVVDQMYNSGVCSGNKDSGFILLSKAEKIVKAGGENE